MKRQDDIPLYRIGDYAHFMGVSTDLLKHYEKLGLIHSETARNGYRYYSFQQSAALLECMRLQNYGLSLREMHTALYESSFGDVKSFLDTKIDDMEKRLRFQQLVIDEHRRISQWMEMMQDKTTHITIKESEPIYFLPQSRQRDFIQDERITALLPSWVDAMPMVKSCRLIPDASSGQLPSWGLAVTQSQLEALQLPLNDMVQRIEGGPFVHAHFRHRITEDIPQDGSVPELTELIRSHNLRPGSSTLLFAMMRMELVHGRILCGWLCAPLAESSEPVS